MVTVQDKLEPVAIVGMSWRFPGEAHSVSGFWDVLRNGKTTKSLVPKDRFDPDAHYHPSADRQGAITTKSGHFLKEDIGLFDAPFFSMTAAEAEGMDPQHRILLEVTYEAFENAGIPISKAAKSQTAVMVGCFTKDYEVTSGREGETMSPYASTGCGSAMLANRLSWFYDLRGPSLMVDTACSSSLVGLHMACQTLLSGQSNMAVVAGTNLMIQPEVWRGLSALRFTSPDGECHSFDSRANGYARGEGMGVVVLKPLADALQDNDIIRAVIRGTGMNQDGKTPGITVPNSDAQRDLIRSTYEAAGLDFSRTTYFEAHGTGTSIGDPLELSAIGNTIGASKTKDEYPLLVGSVKSNIGHLEGASGIAGLIKTVLALESGMIPPVHGFENPNPRFQLEEWNIRIPAEFTPWPTSGLRRASVNSFGYGGTNSHVILDDALHYLKERQLTGKHNTQIGYGTPVTEDTDSGVSVDGDEVESRMVKVAATTQKLFVFSSPEQEGVARIAQTYIDFVRNTTGSDANWNAIEKGVDTAADLAYALSQRRTIFDHRGFAVASSLEGLRVSLERSLPKSLRAIKSPSCAWVFTGQGAQWFAMGRELQTYKVFESSVNAADNYISSLGSAWSVFEELNRPEEESRINEPQLSQPLCTVVQVALVELLKHWGLCPKAVVGHSSGEIAAAYASGALSREGAWKVAYLRGVYSAQITSLLPDRKGSMMAASISEDAAHEYLSKVTDGEVVVACINSPKSVTISGDASAVSEIENLFKADDIWCRKLKVQTAYHSPHMKVIAEQYRESIQNVVPSTSSSDTSFFSSVTGSEMVSADMGPEYWVKNLLSPVRFSDAVTALLNKRSTRSSRKGIASVNALVEIGPHSALQGPLRDIATHISESYVNSVSYTSLLLRGTDATESALNAAGRLWSLGFKLDLEQVNGASKPRLHSGLLANLPRYPFNHKRRYWHEARNTHARRTRTRPRTDLLGLPTDDHNAIAPRWTNFIRPVETPWIMEHRVQGIMLFPGAAMLSMVLEACKEVATPSETILGYQFQDVNFLRPMVFASPAAVIETVLQFRPHNVGTKASGTAHWTHFNLLSIAPDNSAIEHCSGLVKIVYTTKPNEIDNGIEAIQEWESYRQEYLSIREKPTKEQYVVHLYNKLNSLGLQFGPLFRNITQIHTGDGFGYAELQIPDTAARMPENFEYPVPIHPTVLDAVFQMMICCGTIKDNSPAMAPTSIESLYISASLPSTGSRMTGFSTLNPKVPLQQSGNVIVSDDAWTEPKILLKGFVCNELASTSLRVPSRDFCTRLDWRMDLESSSLTAKRFLSSQNFSLDPALATSASLCDQAALQFIQKSLGAASVEGPKGADQALQSYANWMRRTADVAPSLPSTTTDVPETSPAMGPIEAVGNGLDEILNPGAETRVILTDEFVSNYLENAMCRSFINSVMTEIMGHVAYVSPNTKILEVGDGSISCAISILERLTSRKAGSAKYTLTARKQETLSRAQDVLRERASVDFKVLDIEQNVESQGFEPGHFDYIIFNDLLPNASDMGLGLLNLKKLLNPDGKLLLGAITKSQLRTSFVLGSDPRWRRDSQENASGSSVPLDEDDWDDLLKKSGFKGVDHLIHDSEDAGLHQLSVMISSVPQTSAFDFSEVVIIDQNDTVTDAASALSANVANLLLKSGFSVSHATLDAIPEVSGKVLISLLEIERHVLEDMSEEVYEAVKNMVLNSAGILWITRGGLVTGSSTPSAGVSTGLFRAIRSEDADKRLGNLDLSLGLEIQSEIAASLVSEVFGNVFKTLERENRDCEFAEDNGYVYVPRVSEEVELNSAIAELDKRPQPVMEPLFQEGRPLKMVLGEPGLLSTFQFVDDVQLRKPLKADYVEMKVLCTGLNFVDVMAALGQVPTPTLGCEVGGIITNVGSDVTKFKPGDIVAGMLQGSFNTHVRIRSTIIQHVPEHMTVEGATTVVVAFLTAWIGLVNKARLHQGDTALIHFGAGGVGQAAIQICQHFGVEVYTTVGSIPKKKLVMERYGIPEDHIFNSRDSTFAQGVMRMTNGRGVDVVLNSVSGELLRQSWRCLADFGRFVEIGKRDLLKNTGLDMEPFLRGVTYIGMNLEQFHQNSPVHMESSQALEEIFNLLRSHRFKELNPITVYKYSEVEQAFRALQSGKVSGKIVVRTDPDDIVPVMPRAKAPFTVDSNATYLLAGGLGGIGRSIAYMLQAHGARHLVFVSRSGDSKDEAKDFLKRLRRHGCIAKAYACDISDREKVVETIKQCESEMPPIKGLIQCSMALKDGIFENMSYEDWTTCTRPKIQGSWNLHEALPKDLDFFVMLSSISGVIGNPGQANYAAGNVFEDALAHFRRRRGLKATALDLGAVCDIGYIAESQNSTNFGHVQALQIGEADIHRIVKFSITGHTYDNYEIPAQVVTGLVAGDEMEEVVKRTRWARDVKFSPLWRPGGSDTDSSLQAGLEAFTKAESLAAAAGIAEEMIVSRIAKVLMIPTEDLSSAQPLSSYGVNSLIAVEIRSWMVREFQTEISVFDILSPIPLSALAEKIVKQSNLLPEKLRKEAKDLDPQSESPQAG